MLTDPQRHLIAAAVDGRLTPGDQLAFRSLVAESRDALTLFQTLQSQAGRLGALPKVALPRGRSAKILQAVAQAVPPIARPVTPRVAVPAKRSWLPYAVAASTLLAVSSGSFWFAQPREPVCKLLPVESYEVIPSIAVAQLPVVAPDAVLPAPREVAAPQLAAVEPPPVAVVEVAPEPRVRPAGDIVGSGAFQQRPNLAALDVRLPVLAAASKLDQPEVRQLTLAEFKAAPAVRIDLFSRDSLRAVQALQVAAKNAGVTVSVDGQTAERIKKGLPLAWAFYAESLTPDDLAKLLDQVAVLNREAGKDSPFGATHVGAAGASEARDLKELLGVEPTFLKRAGTPAGVAASTADRVAANLTKSGKAGLVLTFAPANARTAPAASAEVRGFLAGRGERKPGTTPVLIVVRPAN